MSDRPSFNATVETRLIYQELAKANIGDVIEYERLSEITSRQLETIRPNIQSAMRMALRNHDMVFAAVRGDGIKRLDDSEIVADGSAAIIRLRRRARRNLERQSKANFDNLSRPEQMRLSAEMSINSAVAMMTRESSVKKIEAKADPKRLGLPIRETLSMFK